MDHTELIITPEQLHDAANALAGTVEGLDTVEQVQARLWTWLQAAVGALIDDAAIYATSPQSGFLTRAFWMLGNTLGAANEEKTYILDKSNEKTLRHAFI